jgi:hypothetical protein
LHPRELNPQLEALVPAGEQAPGAALARPAVRRAARRMARAWGSRYFSRYNRTTGAVCPRKLLSEATWEEVEVLCTDFKGHVSGRKALLPKRAGGGDPVLQAAYEANPDRIPSRRDPDDKVNQSLTWLDLERFCKDVHGKCI